MSRLYNLKKKLRAGLKYSCPYTKPRMSHPPCMHALYSHVPKFLKLYKNVAFFNQQGMEKYNDVASKNYFRSSNHRGISALKQLLLKNTEFNFWKLLVMRG